MDEQKDQIPKASFDESKRQTTKVSKENLQTKEPAKNILKQVSTIQKELDSLAADKQEEKVAKKDDLVHEDQAFQLQRQVSVDHLQRHKLVLQALNEQRMRNELRQCPVTVPKKPSRNVNFDRLKEMAKVKPAKVR